MGIGVPAWGRRTQEVSTPRQGGQEMSAEAKERKRSLNLHYEHLEQTRRRLEECKCEGSCKDNGGCKCKK